jgi:translocation and assembly module TamB
VGLENEASLSGVEEAADVPSPSGRRVVGDIEIGLDGPFFVRGDGVDSSWSGSIRLRSSGGPWRVTGAIYPRRGTYEFFGRRFTLTDSRVLFDGAYPVVPVLDVTAEYRRAEITARLRITGRLVDPKLALESDPDLPADEIMARVMFGTAATGLTPLQTAQLGLAVASMARTGPSSFDFMGRTRDRLGVDELGLRENASDASQVELVAGRYVSDRLFLEYSQRIGSREAGLRAEYEINRHLSLETSAGAQLRPGIRVNVRLDY